MDSRSAPGHDELDELVAQLVGQPCLWHVSDDRYGALIYLGERVERPRPLPNEHLTAEQQHHTGTHSIFINCECRLQVPDELPVRAISTANFGFLDLLSGRRVVSALVGRPGLSLRVVYEEGIVLDVEPRRGPYRDTYYVVRARGTSVNVLGDGSVVVEQSP